MKPMGYRTILALGLAAIFLFASCKRSGPIANVLQLKRISVPSHVFSIAGEVLAFEAMGEAGRTAEVPVSLEKLQSRWGRFGRVFVYEYTKDGKVLSRQEMKVNPDASVAIKATTGSRYLLYPDLGERFLNTYVVICGLERAHIAGEIVPHICTQILCTDTPFQASQLKDRIPELKNQDNLEEFGSGVIGGFGGRGNICDQCLGRSDGDRNFVPAKNCSEVVPLGSDIPSSPDRIVYTHTANFHEQIYKIEADGTGAVNLSNNAQFELSPDVNHRTNKIVFEAIGEAGTSGITTMDQNGNNRTVIPGTVEGGNPKWSRNDESFIIYTQLPGNVDNALHRVHLDGSDDVEIAKARKGSVIRTADVVDDNHVVFWQSNGTTKGDLFIKDMRDGGDPVNLTNTPDVDESAPVISHYGSLIAYIVHGGTGSETDEIHVARLTLPSTLTELHVIRLSAPAGRFLGSLDFSRDDTRVFVDATVLETEGTTNTHQLFSIKLDGTGQFRVTVNDEDDSEPSVVPR